VFYVNLQLLVEHLFLSLSERAAESEAVP